MAESATSGAYRLHSTLGRSVPTGFWYVRPFLRTRLPVWASPFALTAVAFGAVALVDWLAVGSVGSYDSLYLPFHLAYFSFTGVLLGRETERILDYAESIGAGSTAGMRRTLYSTKWALLLALPIEAVYIAPVLLAPGFTLPDLFHHAILLGVFHILVGATAVWAFAYSMRALHALGSAPLSLKPFTEDRSLGLPPFGSAALRLVAIYEVAIFVGVLPMIMGTLYDPVGAATFAALALVGAALFFLPLQSFRRQMRAAKARELGWIGPRYEELVRAVRDSRGSHVDEAVVGSLSALDKIQRDVQQIHTWPLDAAIVARLASVTVLPLVVAVVAREVMKLVLHV